MVFSHNFQINDESNYRLSHCSLTDFNQKFSNNTYFTWILFGSGMLSYDSIEQKCSELGQQFNYIDQVQGNILAYGRYISS